MTEAEDIDVVDVVTPHDSHGYLTESAAAAGKDIVCEKPLAASLAAAEQMVAAVDAAGIRTAVCFVYRTWPAIQLAKTLIDSGGRAPCMGPAPGRRHQRDQRAVAHGAVIAGR